MVPPKDRRSVLFSSSRQTSISNKPPASQRAGGETVNYEVAYFISITVLRQRSRSTDPPFQLDNYGEICPINKLQEYSLTLPPCLPGNGLSPADGRWYWMANPVDVVATAH